MLFDMRCGFCSALEWEYQSILCWDEVVIAWAEQPVTKSELMPVQPISIVLRLLCVICRVSIEMLNTE